MILCNALFENKRLYPIVLPSDWQPITSEHFSNVDNLTADWIQCESSLTVRIKELGIAFNVEVLSQLRKPMTQQQEDMFGCPSQSALHREVLLKQGDLPLVYAQTVMPDSTVSGTEAMLAELGNQSLGQVLFQSPQAIRGQIEFAAVAPSSQLAMFIEQQLQQPLTQTCYIRRSLFQLNRKPLLVCECFLPALFNS